MKQRWPEVRASDIVGLPLREDVIAPSQQVLVLAVWLVLLVARVNVANLVLLRATGRVQEVAIGAALGSSRGRLMVEGLVLAGSGGVAGLALAALGVKVLKTLGRNAPRESTRSASTRSCSSLPSW